MRNKVIAGNWKMNKTPSETVEFINGIKSKIGNTQSEVVLCVPFIDIIPAIEAVKGTSIKIGAQNMHFEESGAYTGEISAEMLKQAGVSHVIIGHSERRMYFSETDEIVNKKLIKAVEKSLIPIVCIGETLEQRKQGITLDLVRYQTKIAFHNVSKEDAIKVVIAYEPIWAIGTGETATSKQAEDVCAAIRNVLVEIYDTETAEKIAIQYGGSVNAANAKELFGMPNIDGGLVGGASLKAEFESIVNY